MALQLSVQLPRGDIREEKRDRGPLGDTAGSRRPLLRRVVSYWVAGHLHERFDRRPLCVGYVERRMAESGFEVAVVNRVEVLAEVVLRDVHAAHADEL